MSAHVEWMPARDSFVELAEEREQLPDGQRVGKGKLALVISSDDVMAIEGTREELAALIVKAGRALGLAVIPQHRPGLVHPEAMRALTRELTPERQAELDALRGRMGLH
jgi:hypothetical protein